jgi:hypothetical protein
MLIFAGGTSGLGAISTEARSTLKRRSGLSQTMQLPGAGLAMCTQSVRWHLWHLPKK